MTSLINAGKDLLNVFPVPGMIFGAGYGAGSLINAVGYLQTTSPLWCATAAGSIALVDSLVDFTTRRISRLNWISKLSDKIVRIDKEIMTAKWSLYWIKKSDPKYNETTQRIETLEKEWDKCLDKVAPYKIACILAAFAITYFSQDTALKLVNSALTSAVTYLPSAALTVCGSLSMTPTGLIVSTIFVTGWLISTYQYSQLQPVSQG